MKEMEVSSIEVFHVYLVLSYFISMLAIIEGYNDIIRHETVRVALIGNMKDIMNGLSRIPKELHPCILQGALRHLDYCRNMCGSRARLDGKNMRDFFGEERGQFDFTALLQLFEHLISSVEGGLMIARDMSLQSEAFVCDTTAVSGFESVVPVVVTGDKGNSSPSKMISGAVGPEEENSDDIPEELKCGVCFDIIATAAVLNCGHAFCFLCIHQWLARKQMCPACRETCNEDSLRRIFTLDTIAEREAKLRHKQRSDDCAGTSTHDTVDDDNVAEDKITDGHVGVDLLKQWYSRRDEGIALANGKRIEKKVAHQPRQFYENGYDDDYSDGDDDGYSGSSGVGMGAHSFGGGGGYGYFSHLGGSGVTLGGSGMVDGSFSAVDESCKLSSADLMAARLKRFQLQSTSDKGIPSCNASSIGTPSMPGSSSSSKSSILNLVSSDSAFASLSTQSIESLESMGFARCDVERCLYAAQGNCDQAAEYLLSGIPTEALPHIPSYCSSAVASGCSSNQVLIDMTGEVSVASSPPAATAATTPHDVKGVPTTPAEIRAREVAVAKEKQRIEQLEKKRLRLEIERDREERRRCGGRLPATHETLFSKDALGMVEEYAKSSPVIASNHASALNSAQMMHNAFEKISDRSVNSSNVTVQAALSVVAKILQNIDENPSEEKYRSINTAGKIYKEKLSRVVGVKTLLHALGFKTVSPEEQTEGVTRTSYLYMASCALDSDLIKDARSRLFILQEQLS